jgi:hypothetical protein
VAQGADVCACRAEDGVRRITTAASAVTHLTVILDIALSFLDLFKVQMIIDVRKKRWHIMPREIQCQ